MVVQREFLTTHYFNHSCIFCHAWVMSSISNVPRPFLFSPTIPGQGSIQHIMVNLSAWQPAPHLTMTHQGYEWLGNSDFLWLHTHAHTHAHAHTPHHICTHNPNCTHAQPLILILLFNLPTPTLPLHSHLPILPPSHSTQISRTQRYRTTTPMGDSGMKTALPRDPTTILKPSRLPKSPHQTHTTATYINRVGWSFVANSRVYTSYFVSPLVLSSFTSL